MKSIQLILLSACLSVGLLATTANAQVVVYRPVAPVVPTTTYYAPAAQTVAAPVLAAPVMSAPVAVTSTYYRGRVYTNRPVVAYYQTPMVQAPVMAPVVAQPAPIVAQPAPVVVQRPVARTTYYAPSAVAAPIVATPVAAVAPPVPQTVYYNPGVVITRPAYVPGQPIRNLFR